MTPLSAAVPAGSPDSAETAPAPAPRLALLPAAGVSASAFCLFALQLPGWGHGLLVLSLLGALLVSRELAKDLTLIGIGIAIVSTTSVVASVDWDRFLTIGTVLLLAVAVPVLVDRLLLRRRAIRFPLRTGDPWNRIEKAYILAVPFLGWLILPFYFVTSGVYRNWPPLVDGAEVARFFVGVNFVGTWDELFFICTCFALLRRHFGVWTANLLQAAIFVSFLWELGYQAWGPLLTAPFALLQGWLFSRTGSLLYVLIVHLLFDVVVFLAIVHARHPGVIGIFLV
ncbi:CPBP family intramembrane glutamic endopeptidase [Brachybacterium saurashtrense]|uniref:CPBP family intramembrane metalloprotease n=1 Tax=Brachybacterium saurashtrense TaxID=556288 RepID=A0A345YKA8_9MICO|nr:CPBP family intramembrane glutamic endopeptidase [Brachybacterium saurashtrense]AXK44360.1 CPBP family intramembrane metalloprotease [Brachybacterium saurashtrense]RRR21302.1 CPBP family intramembrane metalloprotease [Brachybacterium saurashtrense]RRR22971.1 CPBP family intramembrane metalloprotease [Brachybacterium saurashtrense]